MRILSTLIMTSLLFVAHARAADEKTHDITVQIQINCPESDEFTAFEQSIPEPGQRSNTFEEWKTSFVANMNRLISLVESGQVNGSSWGVNAQEHVQTQEESLHEESFEDQSFSDNNELESLPSTSDSE
jgi:hypothetical protein